MTDARASLAGRLRAEVDFSFVNRAPDEAARVALAYVTERMKTSGLDLLLCLTWPGDCEGVLAPCPKHQALLALIASKVTG